MNSVIVNVGKELLTGQTLNTNLKTIASFLLEIGVDIKENIVLEDDKEAIKQLLLSKKEDIIILTGGLGPTDDDLTKEAVFEAYNLETFLDKNIERRLKEFFEKKNISMASANLKQAIRPKNAIVINNNNGTAPGLIINVNKQIIVLLPGPPNEQLPMLEYVISYLKKKVKRQIFQRSVSICGIGESSIESKRKDFALKHEGVSIFPYASVGTIKFVFRSFDKKLLEKAVNDFTVEFAPYIYDVSGKNLEETIVVKLAQKKWRISFAESCTGGLLAANIVNVAGASAVFSESFVVYANEAKMKYLDVSKKTLDVFGAVSAECALEMAINLQKKTRSDVAISVSGIAGPSGGSEEKPVGLVYFGFVIKNKTYVTKQIFSGDRYTVRLKAVRYALCELLREMDKNESSS